MNDPNQSGSKTHLNIDFASIDVTGAGAGTDHPSAPDTAKPGGRGGKTTKDLGVG